MANINLSKDELTIISIALKHVCGDNFSALLNKIDKKAKEAERVCRDVELDGEVINNG